MVCLPWALDYLVPALAVQHITSKTVVITVVVEAMITVVAATTRMNSSFHSNPTSMEYARIHCNNATKFIPGI